MNLRGPLGKLQRGGAGFYSLLAQRFMENELIHDTWTAMATDLLQQQASLKAIRPAFWFHVKAEEKQILQAIQESLAHTKVTSRNNHSVLTLHDCFERTLQLEEPLVIRVYAPLIRQLRLHWTDRALDFYVIVNAHVTRLAGLIAGFSGDPALIQRCGNLLNQFEMEAQRSETAEPSRRRSPKGQRASARRAKGRKEPSRRRVAAKPQRTLLKKAKTGAKHLVKVEKIDLQRRRHAQR